jgi:predicted component of type VI protein secretion system
MPYISFKDQSRPVGPGVLTIGGGHEASWRIAGYDLAPLHAVVAPERDGRAVIMRGSPFATVYINGAELDVQTRQLEFGDVIRLGAAELRYVESSRDEVGTEGFLCDVRHNRVFKLTEQNAIGRDLKCNILLNDATASRLHADIRRDSGRYVLTPTAGVTFVNGRHVAEPVTLKDGDEIGVGRSVLKFSREMPTYATEAKTDPEGRTSIAGRRASQVQTTFMGVVEQREQMRRQRSRVLGRVAVVVIGAAVVLGALVSAIYGRKPVTSASARTSSGGLTVPAAAATTPSPPPPQPAQGLTSSTSAGTVTSPAATPPRR